jgi:hypothetical protein
MTNQIVSRAQRSTISAFTSVFAHYGGAPQTRDRRTLRVCNDPGSAVHRYTLHRIRETGAIYLSPPY